MDHVKFKLIDSLEKVFPSEKPRSISQKGISLFQQEKYAFQIAYNGKALNENQLHIQVHTDESISTWISVVKKVPSNLPAYPDNYDENYLSTTPGLYPDLLVPLKDDEAINIEDDGWNAIWIDVQPNSVASGNESVTIKITGEDGRTLYNEQLDFRIIPYSLP